MKSLVFISHIREESVVAIALKDLIEPHFLGLLEFFVSSGGESIAMGQKWLDAVSATLKSCAVQIVVCSPKSVTRPWINFEAGAAWIRDIPVIPLCHSGMNPSDLPLPLSLLQGAKLTDIAGMNLVIPVMAHALGAKAPKIDLSSFVGKVRAFEEQYTFWDECNAALGVIDSISPSIITILRSHSCADMDLPQESISAINSVIPFLRSRELMDFRKVGRLGTMHPGGEFYGCQLLKLSRFNEVLASPQLKQVPQPEFALKGLPGWLVRAPGHQKRALKKQ